MRWGWEARAEGLGLSRGLKYWAISLGVWFAQCLCLAPLPLFSLPNLTVFQDLPWLPPPLWSPHPTPAYHKYMALLRTPGAPPLPDRSSFPLLPSVFPASLWSSHENEVPQGKLCLLSLCPTASRPGACSGGTSALTPKKEGTSSRLAPRLGTRWTRWRSSPHIGPSLLCSGYSSNAS